MNYRPAFVVVSHGGGKPRRRRGGPYRPMTSLPSQVIVDSARAAFLEESWKRLDALTSVRRCPLHWITQWESKDSKLILFY